MKKAVVLALMFTLMFPVLSGTHVFAQLNPFGFVALPLGDNTTKKMEGNFGMPYSVGVYRVWDDEGNLITTRDEWCRTRSKHFEKVGFTYGERVVSKVPGGLWAIGSFTPCNLQPCKPGQEHTARVMWGNLGPEDFDLTAYFAPGDVRPSPRERRQNAKATYDPGYETDCTKSGPSFGFAIPTSDIPANQTTFLVLQIFGPMGKSSTKWLFWTSVATKQGTLQEPLGIARFTAPREWVEKAPVEQILKACVGLESPYLTEEAPPETTTTQTRARAQNPETSQNNESRGKPTGTPKGVGFQQEQPVKADAPAIVFRMDGMDGDEVKDGENIRRDQRVYVCFSRGLREGERFEYGASYVDRNGQTQWTQDAEGNPFPVPTSEVVGNHFFLRFDNTRTVAPGEHALFIRVVGPNGVLAEATKTVVIKEVGR